MTNDGQRTHLSLVQRKQQLIQEGTLCRAQVMYATNLIKNNLRGKSFVVRLTERVISFATSTFGGSLHSKVGHLQSIMPLLMTGISILSKRGICKPKSLLIGGVLAATVAVVTYWGSKVSKAPQNSE